MSSDTLYFIKEIDKGIFNVYLVFDSDEDPTLDKPEKLMCNLEEAIKYAQDNYTEYGYYIDFLDHAHNKEA